MSLEVETMLNSGHGLNLFHSRRHLDIGLNII